MAQASEALTVALAGEDETLALGRLMAQSLDDPPGLCFLLSGGLGAGKTTLVRGFVSALPGSEAAEVASPSFNICNRYPTRPPVAHYDLYRLEGFAPDEELLEDFSDLSLLVIVEWSQYLEPRHRPLSRIDVALEPAGTGRLARLASAGERACACLARIGEALRDMPGGLTASTTPARET